MEAMHEAIYQSYSDLKCPSSHRISRGHLNAGFSSPDWLIQFQTLTTLRQICKHYGNVFIFQILPKYYTHIIEQIENLRSNNSKQALTLVFEMLCWRNISSSGPDAIRGLIRALFKKSICEKTFLKNEALKAIKHISKLWTPAVFQQLLLQTKSLNKNISQLSMETVSTMMERNQYNEIDANFFKILAINLNGKRPIIQKQAKIMYDKLKSKMDEKRIEKLIDETPELQQNEIKTLKDNLKNEPKCKNRFKSLREVMKQGKTKMNQPQKQLNPITEEGEQS